MFLSSELEYVRHRSSSISIQIPLSLQFLRTLLTLVPFTAPYTQEAVREPSAAVLGHLKLPRVVLVTTSGQNAVYSHFKHNNNIIIVYQILLTFTVYYNVLVVGTFSDSKI